MTNIELVGSNHNIDASSYITNIKIYYYIIIIGEISEALSTNEYSYLII